MRTVVGRMGGAIFRVACGQQDPDCPISRLEATGRHAPSLTTLKKYAAAVGCVLQVKLVPQK